MYPLALQGVTTIIRFVYNGSLTSAVVAGIPAIPSKRGLLAGMIILKKGRV